MKIQKILSLSLSFVLLSQSISLAASDVISGDVRLTVTPADIHRSLTVKGADRTVNMAFHGVAIEDALRALAKKGGFNVLIDESVDGELSVDLNNVTIQDALETIKTYGNLAYSVKDGNLMVADATSERGRAFQRSASQIIPVHHANVRVLADLLNRTLFADRINSTGGAGSGSSGSGSSQVLPVVPDFRTNSLVVVGTAADLKTVKEHVAALDVPRDMKTWRLSHANVLDVATMLSSSLFNEGQPPIILASGGGSSSSSASGTTGGSPTTMRVTAENVSDSNSTSQSQTGTSSSGGGSSGGSGQSVVQSVTLKARVKENQTVQISPNGAILIPDTRLNTLTLLGTAEQIAMAEALIPTMDRKLPQVVLEASLIEVTDNARKDLGYMSGGTASYGSFGTNNRPGGNILNNPFTNVIGRRTASDTPLETVARITNFPVNKAQDFFYQLNAMVSSNKAKILANPTVITTHDNETMISIVDEVIRSVEVTVDQSGTITGNEAIIGDVGIVLNILPKIGADGSVSMRIRPVVSTIREVRPDELDNIVTLLSRRELLAQNVTLKDGESFVLGGLVQDSNSQAITKIPGLSNLPIVGALARNSTRNKDRTELVIVITPHIMNDESEVAQGKRFEQMQPAVLSKGTTLRETGILPVSNTGPRKRTPLPPLEPVQVIGNPAGAEIKMDTHTQSMNMSTEPLRFGPTEAADFQVQALQSKADAIKQFLESDEMKVAPKPVKPVAQPKVVIPEPEKAAEAIQPEIKINPVKPVKTEAAVQPVKKLKITQEPKTTETPAVGGRKPIVQLPPLRNEIPTMAAVEEAKPVIENAKPVTQAKPAVYQEPRIEPVTPDYSDDKIRSIMEKFK